MLGARVMQWVVLCCSQDMCLYLYIYLYVIYCYFVQVGSKCSSVSDVLFLARICFCLCLVIISLFCTYLVQGWYWCSEWCCVCVWAARKEWREAPWGRPRIHRLDHVFIILGLMIQLELSREAPWGYIGPAWSHFHLEHDPVIPHSHIIPQPGHILKGFIFTLTLHC